MSTPDEVRQLIIDAFDTAPMPLAENMTIECGDGQGARAVHDALAGRHWRALAPADILAWWNYFSYLSPEAYRHYLPALLVAGIERGVNDFNATYAVLNAVGPSELAVYCAGSDEDFDVKVFGFTPAQRQAVGEYLGLLLVDQEPADYPVFASFRAARAFRLAWSDVDTPARSRFEAFHQRMRDFVHTPPEDPAARTVYDHVFDGFADTPYPGDDALCGSICGDDEPAESALDFRGVKWQRVHPQLLAAHYTALSFLTAAGLRYFLPAFLIAELCGFEANFDPLFTLTHGFVVPRKPAPISDEILDAAVKRLPPELGSPDELRKMMREREERPPTTDWFAYGVERFADYSPVERLAIISYLEFRAAGDEYHATEIEEALERYWRPSLHDGLSN